MAPVFACVVPYPFYFLVAVAVRFGSFTSCFGGTLWGYQFVCCNALACFIISPAGTLKKENEWGL